MTENSDFAYDPETRKLCGLLLPFGELSRPNISGTEPVMFSADSIELPRDPSVITLNRKHNRYDPIGRATLLEKREKGVYAEFKIADTDEGDAYLREGGHLRKLSAEVAGIVRDGARAIKSKLTGAALVPEGAFASAGLFAIAEDIAADYAITGEETETHISEFIDADGVTWRRVTETRTTTETTEPDADAAEGEQENALMGNIVPDGAPAATTEPRPTLDGLFAALATRNPDDLAPYANAGEMFALSTVQHSGPSGATIGADTQETGYLGELWQRAPYQRRIVPLLTQQQLTNYKMQGWKWVEGKTPTMDDYTGNTAEVPSNALDTEPVTVDALRLAGGHRLDRRFTDFNDQAVVSSYLTHQTEDYKRKTDARALTALVNGATPTAPGAVPAGIAKGLAAIVDGALDVIASENRPGFALVSPELWREIILTPKDDVLAFLNAGFGLESGDMAGFSIQPAAVGTGAVIVGAREAATFYELGDVPIRVEGVQPGNGANDIAVFGYYATLINNAKALRSVTQPVTP
ncbi:phage major capsid protein [Microbacterium sp. XT11]|uniref:phage major capsid protein n=1 Tax=Microbacterium sp. XT11 TaxID=367477 RepID=UPI000832F73B|nr:hypothetical protein [Microbacterium sp. XT11]